jgi:hypothetical protein
LGSPRKASREGPNADAEGTEQCRGPCHPVLSPETEAGARHLAAGRRLSGAKQETRGVHGEVGTTARLRPVYVSEKYLEEYSFISVPAHYLRYMKIISFSTDKLVLATCRELAKFHGPGKKREDLPNSTDQVKSTKKISFLVLANSTDQLKSAKKI